MDSAYQPEKYTLASEKGVFPTPCVANNPTQYTFTDKYALRLVFGKSPYPSLDKWVPARREMVSHNAVSEWTQCVSRTWDHGIFLGGSIAMSYKMSLFNLWKLL